MSIDWNRFKLQAQRKSNAWDNNVDYSKQNFIIIKILLKHMRTSFPLFVLLGYSHRIENKFSSGKVLFMKKFCFEE